MTATLFDTEIAVTNFRMLFAFDCSVCTLYKKRFDIASGLGNPDRFFLPCTFMIGVRPAHEHKCFAEGKASMFVPISEMIPIAVKVFLKPGAVRIMEISC